MRLTSRVGEASTFLGNDVLAVACSAALAVRHARARLGVVVPALADLPAGFRLEAIEYDTASSPQVAVAHTQEMLATSGGVMGGGQLGRAAGDVMSGGARRGARARRCRMRSG